MSNDWNNNFGQRYQEGKNKLLEWTENENLVLADQSILPNGIPDHESWVKALRNKYPERDMIVIGDNFHLFDMPGMEHGEAKFREMSRFITAMPTRYNLTTMFTMEIPKENLRPGVRPKYTDSKNSGGMAFDSKVNMNVYQDMQSVEGSELVWRDDRFKEEVVDPNGRPVLVHKDLPIVEIIVDKNKVTGEKKTIFFRLEPASGRMEECTPQEQTSLKEKVLSLKKNRKTQIQSFAEGRRSL